MERNSKFLLDKYVVIKDIHPPPLLPEHFVSSYEYIQR